MGKRITDSHVRTLMKEFTECGSQRVAAMRADMCRQTAAKYLAAGQLPSALRREHDWATRVDPFAEVWPELRTMLEKAPELQAKTLFDHVCREHPGKFSEGQLRTLQRHIRRWRATAGPAQEVFFPQVHHPGRRLALDFTHAGELGGTIRGEPFAHLLCHCVLTYSNWEWATICFSESLASLRDGLQCTLFRLGHVAEELWTDHSTAATHRPGEEGGVKREFNRRYLDLCAHFGVKPRVIGLDEPHENGDVESLNGALKNRLDQHLLLCGSRDFDCVEEYRAFLETVLNRTNELRRDRLAEELAVMRVLTASPLANFEDEPALVRKWSTVHVRHNTYSVPSRLIGEKVTARVYAEHIDILYQGDVQDRLPRLLGRSQVRIEYRHIIHSLVRKPAAFQDYRYREELFPTVAFRQAYDKLREGCPSRTADLEYLQLLKLAADNMESDVAAVLQRLLDEGAVPRFRTVAEFMPRRLPPVLPTVHIPTPDLSVYDELLGRA